MNAGTTDDHPDLFYWNYLGQVTIDNAIVYGVSATNINAQGIFYKDTGHLKNVALVNIGMRLLGVGGSPIGQNCLSLEHFIMLNCTSIGPSLRWQMSQSRMANLSIRGCHFDGMVIEVPAGGDSVNGGWFDENNYLPTTGISPGTNATVAAPLFVNTFTPGPNSPLRDRLTLLVPIDKDGVTRTAPTTVGAVE